MSPRGFGGSSASKLGVVRSMVLLVVVIALVVLMIGSVMDQHNSRVCVEDQVQRNQEDRLEVDDVVRTDLKQSLNQSSADPTPTLAPWDYGWDLKASNSPADIGKIPDRNLILVRHGQYFFETGKLTPLGREQAEMTGRRLKEMNLTYTSIIHSTLERAAETAQIIHSLIPHVTLDMDHMLREGGPIPPNPTISYWGLPEKDYIVDGPRLEAAFRKYIYRPGREQQMKTFEILVAHGNIFRFFALRALQLPKDAWMRVFIGHASITMLHMRADGTVTMTKFGDTGHMPTNKVTF